MASLRLARGSLIGRVGRARAVLVLALTLAGCDGGDSAPSERSDPQPQAPAGPLAGWTLPAAPPVRLVDERAEIEEGPPAHGGVLIRFDEDELAHWRREEGPGGVRLIGPTLPRDLGEVWRAVVTVRPGGARRLVVTPIVGSSEPLSRQRALRGVVVPIPAGDAEREGLVFAVELEESIEGSWNDVGQRAPLERIEVALLGATPGRAAVEGVALEDRTALVRGRAAGAARLEIDGVVRPTVFVRAASRARWRVRVPDSGAELVWHDAAHGRAVERTVWLRTRGEPVVLAQANGAGRSWVRRSVSLDAWAGRSVALEFGADGDGVGLWGDPRVQPRGATDRAPDVLLYMIDTLRADAVGAWGGAPQVSPVVDRLAREGVRFAMAISSSAWTKPAIPTLMSGLWPTTHGVGATSYADRLPVSVPLVQERFRAGGWRAGAFVANPLGGALSALDRGYEASYSPRAFRERIGPLGHPSSEQLHAALLAWLDEEPDRPAFAYVHTLEVHEWQRPMFAEGKPAGATPYQRALRAQDDALGDLLRAWEERRRGRDLMVVVVSDHGESFGDHGLEGHGVGLYQSQVHVPLLVWCPAAIAPGVVERPVGLADVAPTLLDAVGLPPLPDAQGRSLAPALAGASVAPHTVPAALLRYVWRPRAPRQYGLVSPGREKIIRHEAGRQLGFDLVSDPGELTPDPRVAARLAAPLDRWLASQQAAAEAFAARHGESETAPVEASDLEALRGLGYVE